MHFDRSTRSVPVTLNLHLTARCNYHCTFCWAPFLDVPGAIGRDDWLRLIYVVARNRTLSGEYFVDKITFAGGEPTLLPYLPDLVRAAKERGFTTCIVTNGTGVTDAFLERTGPWLDWLTLSLDSGDERTNTELGRGSGGHVENILRAADRIRRYAGIRVRLNTVVTAKNCDEDLAPLVRRIAPLRWKILQGTRIAGQNEGAGAVLDVTPAQFAAFVETHRDLGPVVETAGAILGSYLMVDPLGRVFSNSRGRHDYGAPVLVAGLEASALQAGWLPQRFEDRGGIWDWRARDQVHRAPRSP